MSVRRGVSVSCIRPLDATYRACFAGFGGRVVGAGDVGIAAAVSAVVGASRSWLVIWVDTPGVELDEGVVVAATLTSPALDATMPLRVTPG